MLKVHRITKPDVTPTAGKQPRSIWLRLLVLAFLFSLTGSLCFGLTPPVFSSVKIGAFDPDAWNGLVFVTRAFNQRADFALRVGSQNGRAFQIGPEIYKAVSEVGPHAPDGSYCRVAWRHPPNEAAVTLEWSRVNETTVVGRLTASRDFRLVLETYFPSDLKGASSGYYHLDKADRALIGQRFFNQVFGQTAQFVVMVDQPLIGAGTYHSADQVVADLRCPGNLTSPKNKRQDKGVGGLEFVTGPSGTAHFVAEVGWSRQALLSQARNWLQKGKVDSLLREKSSAYASRRPKVTGLFNDAAHAIGNSMFWNSLYDSKDNLVFPSISRAWANRWGGWVVGEWDCFFDALLTSLESKAQTEAGVKAILLAQTSTGLVPNMDSGNGITPDRSEPPVGAYCVWKIYQQLQDRQLIEWAYPRLKKWNERWSANRGDGQPWRDGNHDGLLEWGSDRGSTHSSGGRGYLQAAKWESGMDDSPMWDHATYDTHTYTMNLDDVGLNSLVALSDESLSRMARVLGKEQDAEHFSADYARLKHLVRTRLWNPTDGIYENRYWDGRFSKRLSPTNFYPLIAGIATPEQAREMVKRHLLNPKEFWGKYVIPTIARDDPAFPQQFYWRGTIWGPTNYLVYEGLNRYHFDKIAFEYAEKSYNLFMDDWRLNQHDDEQYHAWGGSGGGDIHYTWGALLCMVSLDQYIDSNPWDNLRFGAIDPSGSGELRGVKMGGHVYDVSIGPDLTQLVRDGATRFQADSGVVVRNYEAHPAAASFTIHSVKKTTVTTEEFASGKVLLKIDGKESGRIGVDNGKASFSVPPGEHRVDLQRE